MPGPGSYFNDKITVKKYPEDVREAISVVAPIKKDKTRMA